MRGCVALTLMLGALKLVLGLQASWILVALPALVVVLLPMGIGAVLGTLVGLTIMLRALLIWR